MFLIIGVVLIYTSLLFSIANGSGGGKAHIRAEAAVIDKAVLDQCVAQVQYGATALQLLYQCQSHQISYELPNGGNVNPLAPADKSCHLFDRMGADLPPCGPYLTVTDGLNVGVIAYGDTNTVNLLGDGSYFRCAAFGDQHILGGDCDRLEFSADGGETFLNKDICYAKNLTEKLSRGLTAAPLQFGQSICANNCSSTSLNNAVASNTLGGDIGFYYRTDGTITEYSGSCLAHMDVSDSALDEFTCDCWDE